MVEEKSDRAPWSPPVASPPPPSLENPSVQPNANHSSAKDVQRLRELALNPESPYRDEIVRQIFGDVGKIIDDFSCAVESKILLHGRMYVTAKFICFYSNLFGLEKKIRIPYSHVTGITKENTALVIPNAMSVITFRKEYTFRSFWDREECYKLLSSIHETISSPHPDPLLQADSRTLPQTQTALSPNKPASRPPGRKSASQPTVKQSGSREDNRAHFPCVGARESTEDGNTSMDGCKMDKNVIEEEGRRDPPMNNGLPETKTGVVVRSRLNTELEELDDVEELSTPVLSNEQAFQEELEHQSLKHLVCEVQLPISVGTFQTLFVEDNAPFSFSKFHLNTGDVEVHTSEWKASIASIGFAREIRFIKPMAFAIGPSKTRAVKVQRFKRFGEIGLLLFSSTFLEDIPNCDCFSVEDRWIVKSLGDDLCSLGMRFEVKFLKSTMFKRLIDRTTTSEAIKWLKEFAEGMKAFAVQYNSEIESRTASPLTRSRRSSSSTSHAHRLEVVQPHDRPRESHCAEWDLANAGTLLRWTLLLLCMTFSGVLMFRPHPLPTVIHPNHMTSVNYPATHASRLRQASAELDEMAAAVAVLQRGLDLQRKMIKDLLAHTQAPSNAEPSMKSISGSVHAQTPATLANSSTLPASSSQLAALAQTYIHTPHLPLATSSALSDAES